MSEIQTTGQLLADEPIEAKGLAAETELKFELGAAALRKLVKHPAFGGPAETLRMISVYFDTPAFELRKAGVSLRVRQIDGRFIQTVKRNRSGDMFDRDEWEAEVPSLAPDLAALAGTPAAKALKKIDGAVGPVFKATVDRMIRTWTDGATVVEISVDRGGLQAGKARERLSEMELELKAGDPRVVYDLARQLFEATPIRLSLTSKGERGYRLASSAIAGKTVRPGLTPEMTVAEAFATVTRSCLIQIVDAADSFRRHPAPDCIHQTRIGLRRLRSALKIFKRAVSDGQYSWINDEVQWLADELGGARNLDVFFEETFQPIAGDLLDPKVAARYAEQLEKARAAAYKRALDALTSTRFAKLVLELALWVEDGAWREAADETRATLLGSLIGPFATDALERLNTVVREHGEDFETLDIDRRHKLRIRAKRLRYATDFFAEAFGDQGGQKKRREFEKALKALQTSLGKLNDIAEANKSAIEALGGSSSSALTFAAGEVVGSLKSREPKVLAKAAAAFEDFTDAKRFWPKAVPIKQKKAREERAADEAPKGKAGRKEKRKSEAAAAEASPAPDEAASEI